jgi:hypothetical protein
MAYRIRELLIRQRTQMINALRGHLGELGKVVPPGAANAARMISIVEDPNSGLPADGHCSRTLTAKDSHRESRQLDEWHEQA